MLTLHDTQRQFASFILQDSEQIEANLGIKGNGLSQAQRLSIYRNNTQLGLTEALRDGYPVVDRLVGSGFFNYLADRYIRQYPPKSGCLLSFGEQFAEFIANFEPAHGLPYLPDIASLEWFWHEAFHEADESGLDISALAKVDPDLYGGLGFTLHPSARLLGSDYPVLRIWQVNQTDYQGDEHINLNEGGCKLLIFRPGPDVEIIPLNTTEFLLLSLLSNRLALTDVIEQVCLTDSNFDVMTCLQHWVGCGLLTNFFIA